jgi:hypothetical protein
MPSPAAPARRALEEAFHLEKMRFQKHSVEWGLGLNPEAVEAIVQNMLTDAQD